MTELVRLMLSTALAISGSWALAIIFKATLTLVAALSVAKLCVRSRASVRHLLFAATFGALLLLPLANAVVPAIVVEVSGARATVSSPVGLVARDSTQHADVVRAATSSPDSGKSIALSLQQTLVAAWFFGVVIFSVPIVLGLSQVRRLCRHGLPWRQGRSIIDGITVDAGVRKQVALLRHEAISGPITCGVFKPTILVPVDAADWDAAALQRALVHEVEHVRRGDWATHCLARAICAIYWFHPLVWMAWRQLRLEAERACDDAVVGQDDGREYVSLLITVAQRQVSQPGLPILAMASRGDLSVRVAALLNRHQRRGAVTGIWVVAAAIVAGSASSAVGAVTFAPSRDAARGQSDERSFDVVSIKRNVGGDQNIVINVPNGTAFNTTNIAMRGTIMRAYQVKNIAGAPEWVEDERYDIEARAAGKPTFDEVNAMLRTMLKERLKLKAHIEQREIPVYALVVARPNHPGLKPSTLDCDAMEVARDAATKAGQPPTSPGPNGAAPCGYTWPGGAIHSGGITLARFAGLIDWVAGRVVVDRTGRPGRYEFTLRFAPPSAAVGASPDDRPDLFTALQEQLGLKLEPTRTPVDTLVIDHIDRPTQN